MLRVVCAGAASMTAPRAAATTRVSCVRLLCTAKPDVTGSDSPAPSPPTDALVASGSADAKSVGAPKGWEYMPHFSHVPEKPMEEVANEFKRWRPEWLKKDKYHPQHDGQLYAPKGFGKREFKEINPNPKSPYPIAKFFKDRNERKASEYAFQRHLYQKQLSLLRRKWLMEHIIYKERRAKLRAIKGKQQEEASSRSKAGPQFHDRKIQIAERHEDRMKKRQIKKVEKKRIRAEHLAQRDADMKAVRMVAIETLGRLSTNFITTENLEQRVRVALSMEENYDVDVEFPVKKGFDPNAERADQILRRMQGNK